MHDPRLEAVLPRLPLDVREWAQRNPERALRIAARSLPEVVHFASGSNHPGEIRGFASIGHAVGVVAGRCMGEPGSVAAECEAALSGLAGTGVPVFVDSGAFSEVVIPPAGPPRVVHPMEHEDWTAVLGLYDRLARVLGAQLYVVAPDRVGDQGVTLERLRLYREQLAAIRAAGANVLVPMQRGDDDLATFHARVQGVLGDLVPGWIPAIPMKKAATSDAALRTYLEAVRPPRVHLLGIGPRAKRAMRVLAILATADPGVRVTMDSVLITANVGRKRAVGRLTRATDVAQAELRAQAKGMEGAEERIEDLLADPAAWLSQAQLRKVALLVGLDRPQTRAFVREPAAFNAAWWARGPGPESTPEHKLDALQAALRKLADLRVYHRPAEHKARAIRATFGEVPIRQDASGMVLVLEALQGIRVAWLAYRRAERAALSAIGHVTNEEILALSDASDAALSDLLERKRALTRRAPWLAGWYYGVARSLLGCEEAGTWDEWVVSPEGSVWYEDEAACLDSLIEYVEREIRS